MTADLATMLRTLASVPAVAIPDTLGVDCSPISLVDGHITPRVTIHAASEDDAQRWVDALTAAGVSGWRPESDPPSRIHVAEWRGWVLQVVWLPAAAVRALAEASAVSPEAR